MRRRLQFAARWTVPALIATLALAADARPGGAQPPSPAPAELVRHAVENQIKANEGTGAYLFRHRKETAAGSQTKLIVETRDAMAAILIAFNDHPIGPKRRQAEYERLERFLSDPDQLRKKQKQEKEDAERITRIMKALPDAFLYQPDGTEVGKPGVGKAGAELLRFKFRPNPKYDPPSRVEQVLAGMQGHILVDAKRERLATIDGTLIKDVGFGWGILGHLDRGGHILVQQGEVDHGDWEITRMELAFTGRVLLFKSINVKSSEVYTDFQPVPPNLSFAQGVELLKKQQALLAENQAQKEDSPDPK